MFVGAIYLAQGQSMVQKLKNVPSLLEQIADHHQRHSLMAHQKAKVKQLVEYARWLSNRYMVQTEKLNDYNYLFS